MYGGLLEQVICSVDPLFFYANRTFHPESSMLRAKSSKKTLRPSALPPKSACPAASSR